MVVSVARRSVGLLDEMWHTGDVLVEDIIFFHGVVNKLFGCCVEDQDLPLQEGEAGQRTIVDVGGEGGAGSIRRPW